ncbi:MAG: hypothetical protein RIB64_01495 [Arenibacter algicola]
MNLKEAEELISKNQHLLGQKSGGLTIDDIIAYPKEQKAHEQFIRIYMDTFDASVAILPYAEMDLGVFCIMDKGRINTQGIFLHASLEKIAKELDVNI